MLKWYFVSVYDYMCIFQSSGRIIKQEFYHELSEPIITNFLWKWNTKSDASLDIPNNRRNFIRKFYKCFPDEKLHKKNKIECLYIPWGSSMDVIN